MFEVWNTLQAFYYHWTWHPKWSLNNFLQILTPGSKKACHVMTILICIPCILSQHRFIQNTFFNANFGWLNLYWCQLSVNWFWGQCPRDIWVISCAEIHGETPLCAPWKEDGRSGPPWNTWACSWHFCRSVEVSRKFDQTWWIWGETNLFLFLSPFPEAPLGEIHLTVSAVQDIFNPLSRKPYEGKYLLSPKELPAWTIGISLDQNLCFCCHPHTQKK